MPHRLPPKKPVASRRICERMNGSGSAPMTIEPGWPQGVQQTMLDWGVPRGAARRPTYARCLLGRASADEARSMPTPKAQATNPTESAVLPMGMETSIALLPAPDEYGLRHRLRPAEGHHNCVSLAASRRDG